MGSLAGLREWLNSLLMVLIFINPYYVYAVLYSGFYYWQIHYSLRVCVYF